MAISKKDKRWLMAHYNNPFLFTQKETMDKLGLEHRNDFYRKFYQAVLAERKKEIFK